MSLVEDTYEHVQEEGVNHMNRTQILRDILEADKRLEAQILVVDMVPSKQQINKEDLLASQDRMTFDKFFEIKPPSLEREGVCVDGLSVINSLVIWNETI